jgi:mono/diheme cytochrome c family protein
MIRPCVVLVAAGTLAWAQDLPSVLKQGEEVFNKTCATGYCHGAKGVSGGAPRLAARGFAQAYIGTTVAQGVTGTPMPAFARSLSRPELVAVVAYVATLNGIANPVAAAPGAGGRAPAGPALSPEAARGRDLFSEATRGFTRCSTCHEINGIGMAVTTPIVKIPADAAMLKSLATPNVSSATVDGESMPILMVGRKSQSVSFYDLTVAPPVLRTVAPAAIQTRDDSTWKHSSVLGTYNDAELSAILAYLRATVSRD